MPIENSLRQTMFKPVELNFRPANNKTLEPIFHFHLNSVGLCMRHGGVGQREGHSSVHNSWLILEGKLIRDIDNIDMEPPAPPCSPCYRFRGEWGVADFELRVWL